MICPHCKRNISEAAVARHFASIGGSKTSRAKKAAAIANGKLGGPDKWKNYNRLELKPKNYKRQKMAKSV